MPHLSRRQFICRMAGAGSAVLLGPGLSACASCPPGISPPDRKRRVLADLHAHPVLNEWLKRSPGGVTSPELMDLISSEFNPTRIHWKHIHEAGVDVVCAAHFNMFDEWLSMPTDPSTDAPVHTLQMMEHLENVLLHSGSRYARLVRTPAELKDALGYRSGDPGYRVAVIHTLEGGHALGGNLEHIPEFARRGVALITVTHFFNKGLASSPNAYPFFPDANSKPAPTGLSELGSEVIKRMEDSGIIVDVTHATDTAINDILKVACKPMVATHISSRVLGDHPYSLHDEQIQEISRRRGLMGVILFPHILSNFTDQKSSTRHGTIKDIVRTVRHMVKICGDHKRIAIGTDFSGYIHGPREFSCLGQIDLLRRELQIEFGDPDLVEDLMANNAITFLLEHWGSAPC